MINHESYKIREEARRPSKKEATKKVMPLQEEMLCRPHQRLHRLLMEA
jgi:hypothetical protein